jgi:hypothetical protein
LAFKKFQFKAKTFNPSAIIKTDVKTMDVIKGAFDNFRNVPPATVLGSDPYKSDYVTHFELRQGRLGPSSVDKVNDIVIDNWNPIRNQSGMIRTGGKLTAFR